MTDTQGFADFICRIRGGDEAAAVELVRRYEPLIRREIRWRLQGSSMSRSLDSVDVSQSVLASFFVRVSAGEYDLREPEQLVRLLVTMARHKLASQTRWQFRQKRDAQRVDVSWSTIESVPDQADSPSQEISGKELVERCLGKLTDEERQIAEMRRWEMSFDDIAAQLGGTPQSRRMQFTRAIDRALRELGIND